jgi:hypothetical protein
MAACRFYPSAHLSRARGLQIERLGHSLGLGMGRDLLAGLTRELQPLLGFLAVLAAFGTGVHLVHDLDIEGPAVIEKLLGVRAFLPSRCFLDGPPIEPAPEFELDGEQLDVQRVVLDALLTAAAEARCRFH